MKYSNKLGSENPIVIIGGGTIGLFIANLLVKLDKRIIIIEAGENIMESFRENEYQVTGLPHAGITIGRTKAIGGTSNLWGGQLVSFVPNDITKQNIYNQPQWPLEWKEILQLSTEAFHILGFKTEWDEFILKLNENDNEHIERFYTYWLKQPNLKNHYYSLLKDNKLVTWYSGSTVYNLDFSDNVCDTIYVKKQSENFKIQNFSKVIFANGTLETVRLLLHTKSNLNCPYNNNYNVGKYFQDHINIKVGTIKNPSKKFINEFCNVIKNGNKLQPKIRLIPNSKLSKNYIGVSGYFSFSSSISYNLDNFKQFLKAIAGRSQTNIGYGGKLKLFIGTLKALPAILPLVYRYIGENKIYVPFNSEITLCLQTQQISIPHSMIEIDSTKLDENGLPKLLLNWQVDGREFDAIEKFCFHLDSYLNENNLGSLLLEKWFKKEQIEKSGEWQKHITDIYHQSGGAIMGVSESDSVVNSYGKIHGSKNMYIAGGAILPTSSYANTGLVNFGLAIRITKNLAEK